MNNMNNITTPNNSNSPQLINIIDYARKYHNGQQQNNATDILRIPSVQRGLVWNPTRVEILWDSLMRGIPIGSISIRNNEIFDGQQRAHAITMGIVPLEIEMEKEDENIKTQSILWIDLAPNLDKAVYNRKFAFRLTTAAHPWGFELNKQDDTSTIKISSSKIRHSFRQFIEVTTGDNCRDNSNNINQSRSRPYPYQLWPTNAICPVPFSIVFDFISNNPSSHTLESFRNFLKKYENHNWYKKIINYQFDKDNDWELIVKGVQKAINTFIPVINSNDVEDNDISLYFKRMNKSGIEPDNTEIAYSILKAIVPELKELDKHSANLGIKPSFMASIAVRYWKSRNDKLDKDFDVKDVINIIGDEEFKTFILSNDSQLYSLGWCIKKIKSIFDKQKLPKWHQFHYTNNFNGILYIYLLKLARENNFILFNDNIDEVKITAILSLLSVFCRTSNDVISCTQNLWNCKTSYDVQNSIGQCLKQGILEIPLLKADWENLENFTNRKNWVNEEIDVSRWNKIWYCFGNNQPAKNVLLFACDKYITHTFQDYNPISPEWQDQNIPWDYDHILPKSWIHHKSHYNRPYTNICKRFIGSIGNCAPISYQENRSKSNGAPDTNYGNGLKNLLCIDDEHILSINKNRTHFDVSHEESDIKPFIYQTALRISNMYKKWYEELNIENILPKEKIYGDSIICIEIAKSGLISRYNPEYYYGADAEHKLDDKPICYWSQPTLSVGISVNKEYFIAYLHGQNGGASYVGIRPLNSMKEISPDLMKQWSEILEQGVSTDKAWSVVQNINNLINNKNTINTICNLMSSLAKTIVD